MFNLNHKVILVVGGRGYLGNDFCHHLNKQKATVISADLKTNSQAFKKSNINKIKDNILQLNVNVRNEKSITFIRGLATTLIESGLNYMEKNRGKLN